MSEAFERYLDEWAYPCEVRDPETLDLPRWPVLESPRPGTAAIDVQVGSINENDGKGVLPHEA